MEPSKSLAGLIYLTLQPLLSFIHLFHYVFHPCNHGVYGAIKLRSFELISLIAPYTYCLIFFYHGKTFVKDWQHLTVDCEFGPPAKYRFALGLYIYILLFLRVLFIYVEFLLANYTIKMQTKHFFFQCIFPLLRFTNNFQRRRL